MSSPWLVTSFFSLLFGSIITGWKIDRRKIVIDVLFQEIEIAKNSLEYYNEEIEIIVLEGMIVDI